MTRYDDAIDLSLQRLHDEGRYRTFIDIARAKGQFPHAVWTKPDGTQKDITVWCGNDYLGMGQHPEVLAAMHDDAALAAQITALVRARVTRAQDKAVLLDFFPVAANNNKQSAA